MTLQVLFYSLAVGAALALAAWCCERIAGWLGMARRAAWIAAMAMSIGVPVITVLSAGPRALPAASPDAQVTVQAGAPAPARQSAPADASRSTAANGLAVADEPLVTNSPVASGAGGQLAQVRPATPDQPGDARQGMTAWSIPHVLAAGLVRAWVVLSGSLYLGLMLATWLLHRRAAGWPATVIGGQQVLVSDHVGPALIGAWQPRIVVPRWFLQEAAGLQSLVLAHERAHLQARDPLLLRMALLAVIAVPWNLPLWWQLRRLRRAIELDCDQRVLRAGAPVSAYGHALLQVARRVTAAPVGAVAMGQPASTLESRIRQLQPDRMRHATLRVASMALLAMAGAGLALTMDAPAFVSPAATQTAAGSAPTFQPSGSRESAADQGRVEGATQSSAMPPSPALAQPDALPAAMAAGSAAAARAADVSPPVAVQAAADIGDPAARALQEVLRAHPELLDSPHRNGWYSAAVLLRADGSLFRSGLRFAADRAQAIRDILDQRHIPESAIPGFGSDAGRPASQPMLELMRPGDQVGEGRVLQNHLVIQYGVLPADYDEPRAALKVWEAVVNRHAELLLPRDGVIANRVTVLLAEDGSIAREKVEVGTRAQLLASAPDFTALGVSPQDIGVRGVMTLVRNDYSEVDTAPMDQQMLRAALWSAMGVRDELQVHYAWLRRPGEVAARTATPRSQGLVNGIRDVNAVQSLRSAAAEALQDASRQ